ncbi:MAG: hypothetical protein L0027_00630 [Candidatus Rokubacteria bacterium]|nr:hypothetical protein [Candidatus Rokubacteria bacterium]
MSLRGRALLAFSHDLVPGTEPDWTEWHDREHIPERLGIPGFLRLRRYVALEPGPRFFYFYETENEGVLQSPAYLERLGNPTAWTRRCLPYVTNNKRTACRVSATLGDALGGVLGVLELGPAAGGADGLRSWLVKTALPATLARPGIVAAHLAEADAAATAVKTDEKQLLQTPDAMARWLALVEGVDRPFVAAACAEVLAPAALRARGAGDEIASGTYQLSFVMSAAS